MMTRKPLGRNHHTEQEQEQERVTKNNSCAGKILSGSSFARPANQIAGELERIRAEAMLMKSGPRYRNTKNEEIVRPGVVRH